MLCCSVGWDIESGLTLILFLVRLERTARTSTCSGEYGTHRRYVERVSCGTSVLGSMLSGEYGTHRRYMWNACRAEHLFSVLLYCADARATEIVVRVRASSVSLCGRVLLFGCCGVLFLVMAALDSRIRRIVTHGDIITRILSFSSRPRSLPTSSERLTIFIHTFFIGYFAFFFGRLFVGWFANITFASLKKMNLTKHLETVCFFALVYLCRLSDILEPCLWGHRFGYRSFLRSRYISRARP